MRATHGPYGKAAVAIRLATDAARPIPRKALVMSTHRILTWGATRDEAAARLPGDELLEHADGVSTRAITIDAPAAAVWPWLAQMGPSPRGGAYTYDWIENLLGLDMHSVDRVLPEFQHPQVGDTIGFGSNRMRLERVEPERVLAWRSEDGNWVWTFVLDEHDGTHAADQPQPLSPPDARRAGRHAADGAGVARDGAEDAARDQSARRAARDDRMPMNAGTIELLTRERAAIVGDAETSVSQMRSHHGSVVFRLYGAYRG